MNKKTIALIAVAFLATGCHKKHNSLGPVCTSGSRTTEGVMLSDDFLEYTGATSGENGIVEAVALQTYNISGDLQKSDVYSPSHSTGTSGLTVSFIKDNVRIQNGVAAGYTKWVVITSQTCPPFGL